jgi:hypothetical protein
VDASAVRIEEPRAGRAWSPRDARQRGAVVDLGPDRDAWLAVLEKNYGLSPFVHAIPPP